MPSIPAHPGKVESVLKSARALAAMGMPVGCGRLDGDGNPDSRDRRWDGWQKAQGDRRLGRYRNGDALFGVCGHIFDVIDVDPRNGGLASFGKMSDSLGDDGPPICARVRTARGGQHLYIPALGIGSHNGVLPGIDLKGGFGDGSGRGFVFLPGTERMGGGYRFLEKPRSRRGDVSAVREYISSLLDGSSGGSDGGGGRAELDVLRRRVLSAGAGDQRAALLRYVHELERSGMERSGIIELLRGFLPNVRVFDPRNPWYPARGGKPDKWILSLLHRPGSVVGDAPAGSVPSVRPLVAGVVRSAAEIEVRQVRWIWPGYIARGELTVLDGEKGCGKSLVLSDIVARLSAGAPLPEWDGDGEALSSLILCAESSPETEIVPRLVVAGAVMSRVMFPPAAQWSERRGRGKAVGPLVVLPDGANSVAKMIRGAGADVVIFDPINDFLAEDIQTHNDASIRRALHPLGAIAQALDVGIVLVRHMNKDTSARAKFRGAGSTAYQNRARVHLVAGMLPSGSLPLADARFGIAIVDSNLRRVEQDKVLAYNIEDSDMVSDNAGGMVAQVAWHGICSVSADDMVRSVSGSAKGPSPIAQEQIADVLEQLFDEKDTWPALAVMEALEAAGVSTNKTTVNKVKENMGIRSVRSMESSRGARRGVGSWDWTIRTMKGRINVSAE